MNAFQEVTYTLELDDCRHPRKVQKAESQAGIPARDSVPRIARLLALAIRLEGLIRQGALRDYAEIARRGRVTRARMTQIMKLLDLAPDLQEQILFLPPLRGLSAEFSR